MGVFSFKRLWNCVLRRASLPKPSQSAELMFTKSAFEIARHNLWDPGSFTSSDCIFVEKKRVGSYFGGQCMMHDKVRVEARGTVGSHCWRTCRSSLNPAARQYFLLNHRVLSSICLGEAGVPWKHCSHNLRLGCWKPRILFYSAQVQTVGRADNPPNPHHSDCSSTDCGPIGLTR